MKLIRRCLGIAILLNLVWLQSCGGSGSDDTNGDVDSGSADIEGQGDTDTDSDADTDPLSSGWFGIPSGSGQVESDDYRCRVTVGGMSPAQTTESDAYKIDLGVGIVSKH